MIDVSIVPNMQYLRTEELLMRWVELSAIADGIFRTHIGNLPNQSVQVGPHSHLIVMVTTRAMHRAQSLWVVTCML
jgi:hypothetical protein